MTTTLSEELNERSKNGRKNILEQIIEKLKPILFKKANKGLSSCKIKLPLTIYECSILNDDTAWEEFEELLDEMEVEKIEETKCTCSDDVDSICDGDDDNDNIEKTCSIKLSFSW